MYKHITKNIFKCVPGLNVCVPHKFMLKPNPQSYGI